MKATYYKKGTVPDDVKEARRLRKYALEKAKRQSADAAFKELLPARLPVGRQATRLGMVIEIPSPGQVRVIMTTGEVLFCYGKTVKSLDKGLEAKTPVIGLDDFVRVKERPRTQSKLAANFAAYAKTLYTGEAEAVLKAHHERLWGKKKSFLPCILTIDEPISQSESNQP